MIAGISIIFLLQILCALHVLVFSKQFGWLVLIFFVPLVGAIAYFLVEVQPHLRTLHLDIYRLPGFEKLRIAHLQAQLDECDSADNRYDLAEIYFKYNRPKDAYDTIKPVLQGPLRNHVYMRIALAKCAYENGQYAESLTVLDELDAQSHHAQRRQRTLLRAMNLAKVGQVEAALALMAELAPSFDGEEARYRYAQLLLEQKQFAQACQVAHSGIATFRGAAGLYRRSERVWYRLLHQVLAQATQALRDAEHPPAAK